MTMRRTLYLVLALLMGGMAWYYLPQIAGLIGFCANEVVSEARSPSGSKRALVFTRSCGATTSYGTNVSILSRHQWNPSGPGNLFLAEWDRAADKIPGGRAGPPVQVSWKSDQHLLVTYDPRSKVWFQRYKVKGVTVEYRQRQLASRNTSQ